ncbi:hypothetical protein [Bacillus kwashiorkori]|uniref:hypothetical protein n=1 Tax=Bacillus kwashiorkori TaxID=1522318 RepID=UPI0007821A56|nr:hypothetical protein [Bacillus kwashiorkori]
MKTKKIYLLAAFLIVAGVFILLSLTANNNRINMYSIDTDCEDISINNMILISADGNLYIPGTYSFVNKSNHEITDVQINLLKDNEYLYNWVFQLDYINSVDNDLFLLFEGINLTKDSEILVEINYKVNGRKKEFLEVINLQESLVKY